MSSTDTSEVTIRSPTGAVKDFPVAFEPEWTVKDLKNHLAVRYPTNPDCHSQRIIYQGKLLADHLQIRNVLQRATGIESVDSKAGVFYLISSTPTASVPTSPSTTPLTPALARGVSCPAPSATSTPAPAAATSEESLSPISNVTDDRSPSTPVSPSTPATPSVSATQASGLRHRASQPCTTPGTGTDDSSSTSTDSNPASTTTTAPSPVPPPTAATATTAAAAGGGAAPVYSSYYWPNQTWNPAAAAGYSPMSNPSAEQAAYSSAYYSQHYNPYMNPSLWQAYTAAAAAAAAAHASQAYQSPAAAAAAAPYPVGIMPFPAGGAAPVHAAAAAVAAPLAAQAPPVAGAGVPAAAAPQAIPRPAAAVPEQQPAMAAAPGANAGGLLGAVDEEDEEANQHPRLLRLIASGVRMIVMLSLLYSICTPMRFTLLLITSVLIKLYQAGFFNLRRAPQRRHQDMDAADVRRALAEVRRNQQRDEPDRAAVVQAERDETDGGVAGDRANVDDNSGAAERDDGQQDDSSDSGSDSSSGDDTDASDEEAARPPPSTTEVIVSASRAFVRSIFLDPDIAANRVD